MANQKLSQVQIDGVEYDIGLKSLELGTGLHGDKNIQQAADGVANGLPFNGENIYAENIDATLKDVQSYGAVGEFSAAFGGKSSAQGKRSFTNGTTTIAKGDYSHAEGNNSVALGRQSHAEGTQTVAGGISAHSEGFQTRAIGDFSHAEGIDTLAEGYCSHTEGNSTKAVGEYAHATGNSTEALGHSSSAEGTLTIARGAHSHAEGLRTLTMGNGAHAEGNGGEEELTEELQEILISGDPEEVAAAWKEHKNFNAAIGLGAHAEGLSTLAVATGSHTEGYNTSAWGNYSTAAGLGTVASNEAQSVVGRYNIEDSNALFIVGSGDDAENPSNALSVYPTHSKVGKALSGDQPCLRNIRFGTRSPEVANEVDFDRDESSHGSVTCIDEDRPLASLGYLSGCSNIFYKKPLSECQDLIVIEVEGNSDNILWPIVDLTTVQRACLGPRLFISSASNLVELDLSRVSSDTTKIPTPASQATEPTGNELGFGTSALSVRNNKIYINPQQLMADMSSVGLDINHYKYLYLQFCNSDTYAPAKEPHTLGSPLRVEEGELYLQIED